MAGREDGVWLLAAVKVAMLRGEPSFAHVNLILLQIAEPEEDSCCDSGEEDCKKGVPKRLSRLVELAPKRDCEERADPENCIAFSHFARPILSPFLRAYWRGRRPQLYCAVTFNVPRIWA